MNSQTRTQFETLLHFVQEFYHLPMCIVEHDDDIGRFIQTSQLHHIQTIFKPDILRTYLDAAGPEMIYDLTDPFLLHIIILQLDGTPVILGPFSTVLLSARDVLALLERLNVQDIKQDEFLAYTSSFPCMKETEIYRMVTALIHASHPEEPVKSIQKINFSNANDILAAKQEDHRERYTELLEKRYTYEQAFIRDIEKGNSRSAIFNLHNMHMDVAYLKRIGTTLENERVGAAITRTTVRLAALHAGLPSILVDRLSARNTAATHSAKTVDEILTAKETMVREFCRAIHECRNSRYSALVQTAIYYLEHEYYRPLELKELSMELDVSVNHLIASFHKETGTTPIVYLRNVRRFRCLRHHYL